MPLLFLLSVEFTMISTNRELAIITSWVFFIFLLTVAIYYPGKTGPFVADDYPNFIENTGVHIKSLSFPELYSAWSANHSGPLGRPIASLSFALNYLFAGQQIEPVSFKLTNIVIHAINSVLVFFVARLLFSISFSLQAAVKLGLVAAAIWAVHPLQLTSVLYVVQRMTSLSCLFLLLGFWIWLKFRLKLTQLTDVLGMYLGCGIGVVLGALCKEIVIILPFLMLATEITLLRRLDNPAQRKSLFLFYTITAFIPALMVVVYVIINPEFILHGYINRDFTLAERLMTQARVLLYYLRLWFVPDNSEMGLAHDDFMTSRSLFEPWITLPAIIAIFSLLFLVVANFKSNRLPFLSFAILWFFIGHALESSFFPLEMIYEHRNYLPSIGLMVGAIGLLSPLLDKFSHKSMAQVLVIAIVSSLAFATYARSIGWSSLDNFAHVELRNHPLSARAQSGYAKNLEIHNGPYPEIYEHYRIASQLDNHEIAGLIELFLLSNRILVAAKNLPEDDIPSPKTYDAPFINNRGYIKKLIFLIHKEIVRRITVKSNPLRTAISLRIVATCLMNGAPDCLSTENYILEWTDAVLVHPDFPEMSLIYTIRAKVYFYQGKLEKALENINSAIKLAPHEFYYYAEKADLHITLEQFDEAESILQQAKSIKLTGFDLREWEFMKQRLDTRKAEKSNPNHESK